MKKQEKLRNSPNVTHLKVSKARFKPTTFWPKSQGLVFPFHQHHRVYLLYQRSKPFRVRQVDLVMVISECSSLFSHDHLMGKPCVFISTCLPQINDLQNNLKKKSVLPACILTCIAWNGCFCNIDFKNTLRLTVKTRNRNDCLTQPLMKTHHSYFFLEAPMKMFCND